MSLAKFLSFRTFEIIPESNEFRALKPQSQFEILESHGVKTPKYKIMKAPLWTELANIFGEFSKRSDFIIDGIIIAQNITYVREDLKDPEYAKAFKHIPTSIVKVTRVSYAYKLKKLLSPTIYIEPYSHHGKIYKKLTGKNGKEIIELGLGPGAEIYLGINVVPIMYGVHTSTDPQVPDIPHDYDGVNFIALKNCPREDAILYLTKFFKAIDADFIGSGTCKKLVEYDITTPEEFFRTDAESFQQIFGQVQGMKIRSSALGAIAIAPEYKLMTASDLFKGFANVRSKQILDTITRHGEMYYQTIENFINASHSECSRKEDSITWDTFTDNIEEYFRWRYMLGCIVETNTSSIREDASVEKPIGTVKYILSGSPPGKMKKNDFKKILPANFVEVSTVGRADIVIAPAESEASVKTKDAVRLGKEIVNYDSFIGK